MPTVVGQEFVTALGERRIVVQVEDADTYLRRKQANEPPDARRSSDEKSALNVRGKWREDA